MTSKNNSYSKIFLITFVIFNLAIDQISKIIIRHHIQDNEVIHIIKQYFILTKVENTGAFLSVGSNLSGFAKSILLNGLPIVVLIYGLWILLSKVNLPRLTQLAIGCFIGGGVGNVYDRLVYGSVTDFMFMDFYLFRTGVFNIADMSIMTGLGLLLWQTIADWRKQKNPDVLHEDTN